MSNDRELLKMAAKAAEIELKWMTVVHTGEQFVSNWHPLTDDGDALRLAVKLNIVVWECNQYDRAMVEVLCGPARGEYWEFVGVDSYAATRRAITRAAAEIGKSMP